jgi:hypothetical protein
MKSEDLAVIADRREHAAGLQQISRIDLVHGAVAERDAVLRGDPVRRGSAARPLDLGEMRDVRAVVVVR